MLDKQRLERRNVDARARQVAADRVAIRTCALPFQTGQVGQQLIDGAEGVLKSVDRNSLGAGAPLSDCPPVLEDRFLSLFSRAQPGANLLGVEEPDWDSELCAIEIDAVRASLTGAGLRRKGLAIFPVDVEHEDVGLLPGALQRVHRLLYQARHRERLPRACVADDRQRPRE